MPDCSTRLICFTTRSGLDSIELKGGIMTGDRTLNLSLRLRHSLSYPCHVAWTQGVERVWKFRTSNYLFVLWADTFGLNSFLILSYFLAHSNVLSPITKCLLLFTGTQTFCSFGMHTADSRLEFSISISVQLPNDLGFMMGSLSFHLHYFIRADPISQCHLVWKTR